MSLGYVPRRLFFDENYDKNISENNLSNDHYEKKIISQTMTPLVEISSNIFANYAISQDVLSIDEKKDKIRNIFDSAIAKSDHKLFAQVQGLLAHNYLELLKDQSFINYLYTRTIGNNKFADHKIFVPLRMHKKSRSIYETPVKAENSRTFTKTVRFESLACPQQESEQIIVVNHWAAQLSEISNLFKKTNLYIVHIDNWDHFKNLLNQGCDVAIDVSNFLYYYTLSLKEGLSHLNQRCKNFIRNELISHLNNLKLTDNNLQVLIPLFVENHQVYQLLTKFPQSLPGILKEIYKQENVVSWEEVLRWGLENRELFISNRQFLKPFFNNEKFSDTEFEYCPNENIPNEKSSILVHSAVLRIMSDYYNRLFSNGMRESQINNIEIEQPFLKGHIGKRIIDYFYGMENDIPGTIQIFHKKISDEKYLPFCPLLEAALFYGTDFVKNDIVDKWKQKIEKHPYLGRKYKAIATRHGLTWVSNSQKS